MTVMDLPVLMYPCTSSSFCKISSEAILWLYGGGVHVRMCGVEVGSRGYGAGGGGGGGGGVFQDISSAASRFCVFNLGFIGTTLATKITTLSLSLSHDTCNQNYNSLSPLSLPPNPRLSLSVQTFLHCLPPPPHTHTHPSLRPSALCFSFLFLPSDFLDSLRFPLQVLVHLQQTFIPIKYDRDLWRLPPQILSYCWYFQLERAYMYTLRVSSAVNTQGFEWKFLRAI